MFMGKHLQALPKALLLFQSVSLLLVKNLIISL